MKEQIEAAISAALKDAAGFDIPAPDDFDESVYLAEYDDVARAVSAGEVGSGYKHYVLHGRYEGRRRPTILTSVTMLDPSGPAK